MLISEMAKDDIERLQEQGLTPTFEDIVKLNRLGLLVDEKQMTSGVFALPRCAFVGNLCIRECQLGHGLWLDKVSRHVDTNDGLSMLIVKVFALSRDVENLPDANDVRLWRGMVEDFITNELSRCTLRQLICALSYVTNTDEADVADYDDGETDKAYFDGDSTSVYAGLIVDTIGMQLGISVDEIRKLTLSQYHFLQHQVLLKSNIDTYKSTQGERLNNYYKFLFEVEERLKREKENG